LTVPGREGNVRQPQEAREATVTLAAGSTFGPYQILGALGRGGMAAVYKAYEPALDRYVALKVLPREFIHDPGFAVRFEREAKVIARLEHPNIIPIHNFGIEPESGTPWMAMRFISGGTLSAIIKSGRLEPARAIGILRGVADALDYAHGKGVIHRDVKPQNILLDDAERVYLADFGIAKIVENSPGLTVTGMVTGTPQYMAPEQGMGKTIDNRADIYALGIVAYEMLTGSVPFSADTPVAVLMKHVTGPIPVPAPELVPEVFTRALLKALAKKPEERWPSAGAFLRALEMGQSEAPTAVGISSVAEAPTIVSAARSAAATAVSATAARTAPLSGSEPTLVSSPAPPEPTRLSAMPATSAPAPVASAPPDAEATAPAAPRAAPPTSPGPSPFKGLLLGAFAAIVAVGIIGAIVLLWPRPRGNAALPAATLGARPPAAGLPAAQPTLPPAMAAPASPGLGSAPPATPATRATPSSATPVVVTTTPAAAPELTPATPSAGRTGEREGGKVTRGKDFYERTLSFVREGTVDFDAQVGPLRISSIQFSVKDPDRRQVTLQAFFPIDCPKDAGTWNTRIHVWWLSESGDKVEDDTNRETCKGKTVTSKLFARDVAADQVKEIRELRVRFEATPD
jgi:serine/threonine protein kinase